nr:transposase [Acidithiobacillus thiooxidans]
MLKENLIATQEQRGQLAFAFVDRRQTKVYEYAVLVTDLSEGVLSIAQLYRDRADAENGFNELKNQWGWDGYTTRDLARCRLSARAVGLVYNWWSWYTR